MRELYADRVDALEWVERAMIIFDDRAEFLDCLCIERAANFERYQKMAKPCYATTAWALDWVVGQMGEPTCLSDDVPVPGVVA